MKGVECSNERGQTVVLVALVAVGLLVFVGLAVDGGQAFLDRRRAQVAADAASMAGANEIASFRMDYDIEDDDVAWAVVDLAQKNGMKDTNGNPNDAVNDNVLAKYVDEDGNELGSVGSGAIPSGSTGVVVKVESENPTRFMQLVGLNRIPASAVAAAQTVAFGDDGPSGGGGEDEDESGGPPRALSFFTIAPDEPCTISAPELGEHSGYEVDRDTGETIWYEWENGGDWIKFENATNADGDDDGLGEDRACEVDTFWIKVDCGSNTLGGFTFSAKAGTYEDGEGEDSDTWISLNRLEDGEYLELENTKFYVLLDDQQPALYPGVTGTVYGIQVDSCLDSEPQGDTYGPSVTW